MSNETIIPTPGRLFTWIDVDEHFAELAIGKHWPEWLFDVSAFWDGVDLTVKSGTPAETVWIWLNRALGPITVDARQECVQLENVGEDRQLPVVIVEQDDPSVDDQKLRWAQRRLTPLLADPFPRPDSSEFPGDVALCSFHSYKGGVGRTLHCVALAQRLSELGSKVLVVDADLEAPGITWMAAAQGARLEFSFEDLLALLHGAPDGDIGDAVAVARKFIVNQEVDGVFLLPARRSESLPRVPRIEPTDLLVPGCSRYYLTESLAEVGRAVRADVVLADLRAGVSELNAPFLLDPRVNRVFVTTISDQSVRGTKHVLEELTRRAPGRSEDDPFCSVLITQFDEKRHGTHVETAVAQFSQSIAEAMSLDNNEQDPTSLELKTQPILSPFDPRLLALPASWGDVCDVIENVGLGQVVGDLAADLRRSRDLGDAQTSVQPSSDVIDRRRKLAAHAKGLVYAETAGQNAPFLTTESLTNLVSAHRTDPPVEVVVGAKGSGKTFTYQAICTRMSWSRFARDVGVDDVEFSAPVVPVLASTNIASPEWISDARSHAAEELGTAQPADSQALRELITDSLTKDRSDSEWRRIWLTCFARAGGLEADLGNAEEQLTGLARERRAVFVIDGLEDLFRNFNTDQRQQQALRILLTSCPDWFRSLRGRPLGLLIFVRRDLVIRAIQQNSGQFLARYQTYQLLWNSTEALRLTAWVAAGAEALAGLRIGGVSAMAREALSQALRPLWGERRGSAKSREAGSEAWFLAALTDFNGQIQARDVVTFLAEAARLVVAEQGKWMDRLLSPTAMRQALPGCSQRKVTEISEENPQVADLFKRLRGLPVDSRKVPFEGSQVGLDQDEIGLLAANGVVFQDEGKYWMPEIYRLGLDFKPEGRGRSRVLAIAKRVARSNDSR